MNASSALVFDLDDTLIIERGVAEAALESALQGVGAPPMRQVALTAIRSVWRSSEHHEVCRRLGISSWEALWATFEGCHASLLGVRSWLATYRAAAWKAALKSIGANPSLATAASDIYIDLLRRGHPARASAVEALDSITTQLKCLLTNGPPDIQRRKMIQAGLDGKFDAVAISGETGVGKPDPKAFRHILAAVGVSPDHALMIGDSWERDVEGALGVGMHVLWVSHGRVAPYRHPRVQVFAELTPSSLAAATLIQSAG